MLRAFHSLRSERQLMERLESDRLFRWFVGLGVDEPVWDHARCSKNRDRLLDGTLHRTASRRPGYGPARRVDREVADGSQALRRPRPSAAAVA